MRLRLLSILSALLAVPLPIVAGAAEARSGERIVIANVSVIPMNRPGVVAGRDVVIEAGRIAAIVPHGEAETAPSDRIVDGEGRFLMPGLWDMHAHVMNPANSDDPALTELSSEEARSIVEERLRGYLRSGVTGIRDPGMVEALIPLAGELRDDPALPALYFSGPVIDGSPTPWSVGVEVNLEDPADAAPLVERLAEGGVDFVKVYNRVSPQSFAALARAARERGLPVAGHIPFSATTRETIAGGMSHVEHLYANLFKDCTEAGNAAPTSLLRAWIEGGYAARYRRYDELYRGRDVAACRALYREMGQAGVFVTATPQLDLPLALAVGDAEIAALSEGGQAACRAALRSQADIPGALRDRMIANLSDHLAELRAAEVRLLAGSDAPTDCQGYGRSLHRAIGLYVRLGLDPQAALASATIDAAAAMGRDDIGAVAPGMRADLLLLEANPLDDIANLDRIAAVMLAGRWAVAPIVAATPGGPSVYRDARVWTGSGFETRDLAVEDGRFVEAPAAGGTSVSLAGRFVVPAYGNAHAHRTGPNAASSDYFLGNGVFYVWNPNTIVLGEDARAFFARPDTVDVAIAQGGITEPGGHPERLYVDVLGPMIYNNRSRASLLGDAFHYGRSAAEIEAALDLLQSQGAQFVKAYLLHSEDYALRRDDPEFYGYRGLDPDNLPYLVEAARERGFQVAVHVETAADLVAAARAGVAVAAHLPGHHARDEAPYWQRAALTDEEAATVAGSGMWLLPTYGLLADDDVDVRRMAVARAIQAQNIRLLARHGARFLIGTDTLGEINSEAEHLEGLGVFAPGEVLRIALATGANLYPDRRIGCFDAGCEADFLVLEDDPLRDVAALRGIALRIKAGRPVAAGDAGDGVTE